MLAFSVVQALLLVIAAILLHRIDGLTGSIHELVDYQVRRVVLSQQANQHAQSAALRLLRLLQTPERDDRVALYAAMDAELAASDKALDSISKAMLDDTAQAHLDRLVRCRKAYGEAFQETVELIELEGLLPARAHFDTNTRTALDALLAETLALVASQQQTMQADVERLQDGVARTRMLVIGLALVALLFVVGLARLMARGIVQPVREAVAAAETIASGDYQSAVPVGAGDEIGALLRSLTIMRDSIASREDRILRLAYVDTLTGLPNRTRFVEMLGGMATTESGALAILDVDRFAMINNALGHAVGDRLLCEIATRLQQTVGAQAQVARMWGDEFAVVMKDAGRPEMVALLQKILGELRAPMDVDGQRLDIDASFGVVMFPQDGTGVTALLRRADAALTVAKRRQDCMAFGSDLADEPAHEHLSLIGEMREALARDEFVVFYQPKLNLAKNRITGAEALIRWRHPEKGMIPPVRFIPFAEQTGFIREITPWILRRVIEHASAWQTSGLEIVTSVNLSTRDLLSHALVDDVQRQLEASGLPAAQLCLEITESALMDEPELALRHLHELSAYGVKLSIDDYGSGQASLAYVKTLPVNELKIDRAFVMDVDTQPKNRAIVRSTILLCRELGLSVVAEGAETTAELAWLKENACDIVQGYGVAKPMPLEEFVPWVARFNH